MASLRESFRQWLAPIIYLSNNVISLIGVVLATLGGVSWLFLLPVYIGSGTQHPYLGILFYMLVPGLFFGGLLLIPLGIWLTRRSAVRHGRTLNFPPVNWENRAFRKLVYFVAAATALNIIIAGNLVYAGISYMDSTTFCGLQCHSVMIPEYTAYQQSPHFRVACTECHIGEGASWFVKSKLSGVRQVFAVTLGTYSKPIPTPIHNLRPARETCENCHWPQKFAGSRLVVKNHFADDETNTHTETVLMMHIGGAEAGRPKQGRGIHGFHLDPGVVIRYRSDPSRQTIPWVSYTGTDGKTTVYANSDWDPAKAGQYEERVMDCLDCHNRPSHTFHMPEPALDQAMNEGVVDPSIPWIKAAGMEVLKEKFDSQEQASEQIPVRLAAWYQKEHPEVAQQNAAAIQKASAGILAIYKRNVFPSMNITWGSYPNDLGHEEFPGCWRCHDEEHTAQDDSGKTISQDCGACHELLAMEEENPQILTDLGLAQNQ